MSTNNVVLKDKNGNQLAPATIAEQVSYDSSTNVKQEIDKIKHSVTPEMFGAVGDGVTDDTLSIQSCLDIGGLVYCLSDQYRITDSLRIKQNTTIDLNGSIWLCEDTHVLFNFLSSDTFTEYTGNGNIIVKNGVIEGGCISFIHGENITIENIEFKNCLNNHFIEICACKNFVIQNCSFTGITYYSGSALEPVNIDPCNRTAFPHFAVGNETPYDGTINKHITIINNVFNRGSGDFNNMTHGVGQHWAENTFNLNEDISIINNVIDLVDQIGISIAGCTRSKVEGNRIKTAKRAVRVGFGDSNIVKNNIIEITTNNGPIEFYQTTQNIVIDGNIIENTQSGDTIGRYLLGGDYISGSSFNILQRTQIPNISGTEITLPYDFTLFTDMYIYNGANGNGTFSMSHVTAYYGRTFETNTSRYYKLQNADGTTTLYKVTFDSTDTKKVTFENAPRQIEVETRFTRKQ